MRPLLIGCLCATLLSACAFSIVTPTPTPPSEEFAELLYRAFSFQAMTQDAFAIGAQGFNDGADAMGMALLTIGLLRASADALDREYPAVFAAHVTAAKAQHDALRDIGDRWLQKGTLPTSDVSDALVAIDTNESLRLYAEWLVSVGFSHDDIEMMDVRFRADMKAALNPTPQP